MTLYYYPLAVGARYLKIDAVSLRLQATTSSKWIDTQTDRKRHNVAKTSRNRIEATSSYSEAIGTSVTSNTQDGTHPDSGPPRDDDGFPQFADSVELVHAESENLPLTRWIFRDAVPVDAKG